MSSLIIGNVDAKNKSVAFHLFADLCEVHNYSKIQANVSAESAYIYFEAQKKEKQPQTELILPIDEQDSQFSPDFVHALLEEVNKKKGSEVQFTKIKVGIVSPDCTTVYYDFSKGINSPFTKEQLIRNKETN